MPLVFLFFLFEVSTNPSQFSCLKKLSISGSSTVISNTLLWPTLEVYIPIHLEQLFRWSWTPYSDNVEHSIYGDIILMKSVDICIYLSIQKWNKWVPSDKAFPLENSGIMTNLEGVFSLNSSYRSGHNKWIYSKGRTL